MSFEELKENFENTLSEGQKAWLRNMYIDKQYLKEAIQQQKEYANMKNADGTYMLETEIRMEILFVLARMSRKLDLEEEE